MSVRLFLPVTAFCSRKIWSILMKHHTNNHFFNLRGHFSHFLKIRHIWHHNGFFFRFLLRHFHVFKFWTVFTKLIYYDLQLMALHGSANQRFKFNMAVQNGENDRKNQHLRKTKKKTLLCAAFEALKTNMAIYFASVASLLSWKKKKKR